MRKADLRRVPRKVLERAAWACYQEWKFIEPFCGGHADHLSRAESIGRAVEHAAKRAKGKR